jgi:hypothetical protein
MEIGFDKQEQTFYNWNYKGADSLRPSLTKQMSVKLAKRNHN